MYNSTLKPVIGEKKKKTFVCFCGQPNLGVPALGSRRDKVAMAILPSNNSAATFRDSPSWRAASNGERMLPSLEQKKLMSFFSGKMMAKKDDKK